MGMLKYKLPLFVIVAPQKLYSESAIRGQKIVTCGFGGPPMHKSRDTAYVAFIMGKRYFLPITWLNLRRSAMKVTK